MVNHRRSIYPQPIVKSFRENTASIHGKHYNCGSYLLLRELSSSSCHAQHTSSRLTPHVTSILHGRHDSLSSFARSRRPRNEQRTFYALLSYPYKKPKSDCRQVPCPLGFFGTSLVPVLTLHEDKICGSTISAILNRFRYPGEVPDYPALVGMSDIYIASS